jgi:surface protein
MQFAKQYYEAINRAAAVAPAFISTWRTTNTSTGSSASNQVRLPLIITGTYNFTVNWGDGSEDIITVWNQAAVTHTYAATGDYTVIITGVITGWSFRSSNDRLKILNISQWGILVFKPNTITADGVFSNCLNLDITATDNPTFENGSQVGFFSGCSSLIGNSSFNDWDVSPINRFERFFLSCTNFNQNLSNWDVSNSTNFRVMFQACINFNQNLSDWDVSNSTTMESMFNGATSFNNGGSDGIKTWNVSNVTSFGSTANTGMFQGASSFNQPIGNWDVSSATSMRQIFNGASNFNQDLANWNVQNVTNFISVFQNATAFNQNIGSWNVSNGTEFATFMAGKTNLNYSASNLDSIYNGWTNRSLSPSEAISFGTIKYTAAATAARALLTRANSTVTVTNAVNNGSGLIRITTGAAHGRTTSDKIFISGVLGTTEANGGWIVTVIDATTVDLQASTFTNAYTSGGTFRTGYGWTITDGGL